MNKKLIALLLFVFLLSLFTSCNKDVKIEKELLCGKAYVTKIIGKNRFFGFNNDITIFCSIMANNGELYKGKLLIDVSFLGESYTPFKAGDKVMVKYYGDLKQDETKNIVEMNLLESIDNKTGYKWESPYTFEDACKGNFPKGISFKAIQSKGKHE